MIYADRFLTKLHARLVEEINARHVELGNGSCVVADDPAATGLKCVRQMGVIAGLQAALTHIGEIEDEMSAKPKRGNE